jgi:hypothetical protein
MPDAYTHRTLNEALVILSRSLPMYLSHAAPWVAFGHDEARHALDRMVADHKDAARRLTELLNGRRHTIDPGEFPMDFTGLHDVSIDYLVKQLIAHQKRLAASLERCAQRLAGDHEGQRILEEVANSSRRHLQALESLDRQPAGTAS